MYINVCAFIISVHTVSVSLYSLEIIMKQRYSAFISSLDSTNPLHLEVVFTQLFLHPALHLTLGQLLLLINVYIIIYILVLLCCMELSSCDTELDLSSVCVAHRHVHVQEN